MRAFSFLLVGLLAGCGARSGLIDDPQAARPRPQPADEMCNGLDDNLDGDVDEVFRDGLGRYVTDAHCGRCGAACPATLPNATAVGCGIVAESPKCVARSCARGFAVSTTGECVPAWDRLCLACADDGDCGDFVGARCEDVGGERRCVVDCNVGCADGYVCDRTRLGDGGVPRSDAGPMDAGPLDAGPMDAAPMDAGGDALVSRADGSGFDASRREAGGPPGRLDAGPDAGPSPSGGSCIPSGASCSCATGQSFDLACALRDPMGTLCPGAQTCRNGQLSMCAATREACNLRDDDCNGVIDDGFRDARGAYILDIRNCGSCGVDCTQSRVPEGDLICGGDPFAPRCVLSCPDARDGVQNGDRIDADTIIATGCECRVSNLVDVPGPVRTSGQDLDVNCDGADGVVVSSLYVATDGDDTGPGSPTRPMRTLNAAIQRARDSIGTAAPRTDVFVASGAYTETVELLDGVKVHGGYRRDFLSLDPAGFVVEVRAPVGTSAPGGAALRVRGAGQSETVIEWLVATGLDQGGGSAFAVGAWIEDAGPSLALRSMEVRSGAAGRGTNGSNGMAGAPPTAEAQVGQPPRGAIEARNECIADAQNEVRGGEGGRNVCNGVDVSGGRGAGSRCPMFATVQPTGTVGNPAGSLRGGSGGMGGTDSRGPIMGPPGCNSDICCGLADFTVPLDFMGPQPGGNGAAGANGSAGRGCTNAFGAFDGERWTPDTATGGTPGGPGSGGGGGGAGGGAEMTFVRGRCEFADGLGGGGGGGAAGGCGGSSGTPGTSGGPSIAIYVRGGAAFTVRDVTIAPGDGGRGGDGGVGGDGALGGTGALGGDIPRAMRSTPTLAGPFGGARGGKGGSGGIGGAGGGGCGGPSVGVWVVGGSAPAAWRTDNTFRLGRGGQPGRAGGGGAGASDGAAGGAVDVR